jgi:hypothetical protein
VVERGGQGMVRGVAGMGGGGVGVAGLGGGCGCGHVGWGGRVLLCWVCCNMMGVW